MKRFLPVALVLAVFTTGAAIALARTIHTAAIQANPTAVSAQSTEASTLSGAYLVPGCQQQKPLCDLLTY
jgi:hypothetical protein